MFRRLITAAAAAAVLALVAAASAARHQPTPAETRAVEVRVIEHDEFRWGDAAIGALAGFGLAVLCAGVIVATERRKRSTS